jgi:hypothetical protein
MVKLEEGKYYRTRDGRKVGPMGSYNTELLIGKVEGWSCKRLFVGASGLHYSNMEELDLVSEWVEETTMDIYSLDKPLGWLDEATQQALKDHYYDGGKVEIYTAEGWVTRSKEDGWGIGWYKALIHRAVRKSKVVEVVRYDGVNPLGYHPGFNAFLMGWTPSREDTHKITFNIVDGVPDCNSIKMEKL